LGISGTIDVSKPIFVGSLRQAYSGIFVPLLLMSVLFGAIALTSSGPLSSWGVAFPLVVDLFCIPCAAIAGWFMLFGTRVEMYEDGVKIKHGRSVEDHAWSDVAEWWAYRGVYSKNYMIRVKGREKAIAFSGVRLHRPHHKIPNVRALLEQKVGKAAAGKGGPTAPAPQSE